MGSAGPVAMNYFAQQQQEFKPPLIANENAYLGDVASSEKNDSEAPISSGFFRLEKGELGSSHAHVHLLIEGPRHSLGLRLHISRDEDHRGRIVRYLR
jgi:hypothetical protein